MERPSHIIFGNTQPLSRRLVSFGLAVSFPLLVLWALMIGLVGHAPWHTSGLVFVPVEEAQRDPKLSGPPEPVLTEALPFNVPPPVFQVERPGAGTSVTASAEPVVPVQPEPPVAGPDRAAVSIAATHTIPPYPMLAQRVNAEGKVTLRLTVLTDGSVGMAEIVTSSGRADLDEAARDWIVRHWTYQPALDKGRPVISHVVASIVFRLTNAR